MKHHYPYLMIGGGMAADSAVRGIRQIDTNLPIGLIGEEPDPPYNRPPLSKGLWKPGPRPMPLARIWRKTADLGVDLYLGRKVIQLDPSTKTAFDDQGNEFTFEKLLLATGGDPVRLGVEHERVIYFRTLADYQRLRGLTDQFNQFVVVGGGFIGSELAAALVTLGKETTMIFPEDGVGARTLPKEVSLHLNHLFQEHGILVKHGHLVRQITGGPDGVTLLTDNHELVHADGMVAGLGIRPAIHLAETAGLPVNNGILVDPYLRTSHPDIFAAGDVANFFNPALGRRLRAEHEENANLTGLLAGQNMAGQNQAYHQLPSVYSTLFGNNYDAVGILDPSLETIADWQEPMQKGAIYYLDQHRVRGVLLWNQAHGLDTAREIIAHPGPVRKEELTGRITG